MAKNAKPSGKSAAGQGKPTTPASAGAQQSGADVPSTQNTTGLADSSSPGALVTGDGAVVAGQATGESPDAASGEPSFVDQVAHIKVNGVGVHDANEAYEWAVKQGVRIAVTAKQDGFRRAGRAFGTNPTILAVRELSCEQFTQLCWEALHGGSLVIAPAGIWEEGQ